VNLTKTAQGTEQENPSREYITEEKKEKHFPLHKNFDFLNRVINLKREQL
jgi:hypothetical protein